jgi:hypothetical protein
MTSATIMTVVFVSGVISISGVVEVIAVTAAHPDSSSEQYGQFVI